MPKAIMIVTSTFAPGREDEYNDWYDNVHLPEVVALPGFVAATRYKVSDAQMVPGTDALPYCAVYELDSDDLGATVAGLGAAAGAGKLHMSDAITQAAGSIMVVYEQRGSRQAG